MIKEAERLREQVVSELLPRCKLESWDFDQEDIDKAWEIVDRILAIGQEVTVGSALSRATERAELAERVMNHREEMEQMGMYPEDQMRMKPPTLEDYL